MNAASDLGSAIATFGLDDYLAALALLFVVLTLSDFRYIYRLQLHPYNLRAVAFLTSVLVAVVIIVADLAANNGWFEFDARMFTNIKLAALAIFLIVVSYLSLVAFIRPPVFSIRNAPWYFAAVHEQISRGDAGHLQIVAEELRPSAETLAKYAASASGLDWSRPYDYDLHVASDYAHDLLLLISNRRFCRIVAEKVPLVAGVLTDEFRKAMPRHAPVAMFVNQVASELIMNEQSALYDEHDGVALDYIGQTKPLTKAIFGHSRFIESCASAHHSPFDLRASGIELSPKQAVLFKDLGIVFLNDFLREKLYWQHSYALYRLVSSIESFTAGLYRLNGTEAIEWKSHEYQRLRFAVSFAEEFAKLLDEHRIKPRSLRSRKEPRGDLYDLLAKLVFKIIDAAASVRTPSWPCWEIQHNAVWGQLFGLHESAAMKIVHFKVRRLIYDEIRKMDEYANFQSADYLGYCLNVLGVKQHTRKLDSFRRADMGLQKAVITWTKRNYMKLKEQHPHVAERCIHGSISYDAERNALIKTYARLTERNPKTDELVVDAFVPDS